MRHGDTVTPYFKVKVVDSMTSKQEHQEAVVSNNRLSSPERKKAPAGMLGGAPSMFLCLEDIKRAYVMSLRHKNQDYVFKKI